jgi:hypothetical protein
MPAIAHLLKAATIFAFGVAAYSIYSLFPSPASCSSDSWPIEPFDAQIWKLTTDEKRYVFVRSLISNLSTTSGLQRQQILDMLGDPDNEDGYRHELQYFVGRTWPCPLPKMAFLSIKLIASGSTAASIEFD